MMSCLLCNPIPQLPPIEQNYKIWIKNDYFQFFYLYKFVVVFSFVKKLRIVMVKTRAPTKGPLRATMEVLLTYPTMASISRSWTSRILKTRDDSAFNVTLSGTYECHTVIVTAWRILPPCFFSKDIWRLCYGLLPSSGAGPA